LIASVIGSKRRGTLRELPYTSEYFALYRPGSRQSAEVILPLVFDYVRPRSVIDFGCGLGAWLAVARAHGVADIRGVDGAWVSAAELEIPASCFVAWDLTKPVKPDRRFDLAICVEVAEHLPRESAKVLVSSLVAAAPVVLFSAAIPGQGGVDHFNEQWPGYWATLFRAFDFVPIDCFRPALWLDERVEASYRQNVLLYVERALLPTLGDQARADPLSDDPMPLVHPRVFELAVSHAKAQLPRFDAVALRSALPFTARVGEAAIRRRFRRLLQSRKTRL
jgi:SAM-dependent methyltransferase